MLPQIGSENAVRSSPRTIHVNPNFNKALVRSVIDAKAATTTHINPLFLMPSRSPAIHMNPQFLKNKLLEREMIQMHQVNLLKENMNTTEPSKPDDLGKSLDVTGKGTNGANPRKIITKSRTCIIREPALAENSSKLGSTTVSGPIIRLSRRKLVRASPTISTTVSFSTNPKTASIINASKSPALITTVDKYKVDNRKKLAAGVTPKAFLPVSPRRSFVARYALRRSTSQQIIARRKVLPLKTLKSRFKLQSLSVNKQLHVLNINGVLYKSTRNKLQRKETEIIPVQKHPTLPLTPTTASVTTCRKLMRDRTLFVRGTKFILDANGYKLTRIAAESDSSISSLPQSTAKQLQRIDIGGLTYVASKTQNVFVRTSNHLARAHLNSAKQRSVQLLTSRLMKTNVPCAMFQRVGKCLAHERGRCNKVHDKKQVSICQRFLRSECHDPNCLLSHNVSLSKMPVCKFFLQGMCVRTDCPYLHKKLSTKADICVEFLRGYCKQAEKCNKRHEFICPEYARKGECKIVNCTYCPRTTNKRKALHHHTMPAKKTEIEQINNLVKIGKKRNDSSDTKDTETTPLRYFSDRTSVFTMNNAGDKAENTSETSDLNLETDFNASENEGTKAIAIRNVRPKLGSLPAFIPLS